MLFLVTDEFARLSLHSIIIRISSLKNKPGVSVRVIWNGHSAASFTCLDSVKRSEILTAVMTMIGLSHARNPDRGG
jgi:hypothetical protein